MNVHEALDRLDAIQEQLSRSTPVRGYRAATVAGTAVLAAVGALAQVLWVHSPLEARGHYLTIWVGLALLGVLALALEVGRRYALTRSRHLRHGLLRTFFTVLPAFGTAAVMTAALGGRSDETFALLPGLWMLCFALAIYASLPRLPHGVGFIGCFYFAAGACALAQPPSVTLAPWLMGGVFGLGQAWAAWLLARHPDVDEFPADRRGGRG